jgi:hypothetical protein
MSDISQSDAARRASAWLTYAVLGCFTLVAFTLPSPAGRAKADPGDPPDPLLPVVTVTSTSWTPKFPFPYNANRKDVTDADITAEREMCQWFNPQYRELVRQIDRFGFNLLDADNDWTVGQIQAQADAVAANIDRSEAFLAPRTQALTQLRIPPATSILPSTRARLFIGCGSTSRMLVSASGPATPPG